MLRRTFLTAAFAALPVAALAVPQAADQEGPVGPIRTQVVRFARGATSTTIRGQVTGYEMVDYILGARRGQLMSIRFTATRGSTYYQIILPDGGEPLFDSANGGDYRGRLPASGDYALRVYNFRNEARRARAAGFALMISITR